jgi:membrane carboxypeptidase/penicillin-binding protein
MMFSCVRLLLSDIRLLFSSIEGCKLDLKNREMIILAVVCAEDRRYFSHCGVSYLSIIRAVCKRHGGASTINMQLVRLVTGRYELSLTRKLREMLISTVIDFRFSKIEIIRAYLFFSYYGFGMKGLDGVMDDFFPGKNSGDLSLYDCCLIASLIKRPSPSSLTLPWAVKLNKRMTYVHDICNAIGTKVLLKIKSY